MNFSCTRYSPILARKKRARGRNKQEGSREKKRRGGGINRGYYPETSVIETSDPELSNKTTFFKFLPFYDLVEPFEVDLYPAFLSFSEIIVKIQLFHVYISH